jgi:hypothetical protein
MPTDNGMRWVGGWVGGGTAAGGARRCLWWCPSEGARREGREG